MEEWWQDSGGDNCHRDEGEGVMEKEKEWGMKPG